MKLRFISIYTLLIALMLSCAVSKKVKTGQMAYDLRQYAVAVELFKKEYNKSKSETDKAGMAYYIAKSFQSLNDLNSALKWFYIADEMNYGQRALEELAYSYKSVEQYDNAIIAFEKLYRETELDKFRQQAAVCKNVKTWSENQEFEAESLTGGNTTDYSEYGPVIFEDKFLVFSSDRITSTGNEIYNWTGQDYSDLFIMTKKGSSIYNFEATFNTSANEGTACFNSDYSEIYFTRCESITSRDDYCRIYFSNRESGFWTDPRPLFFFDENTNFGHPTLLENDSVLVFSVETDRFTHMHDLFYSIKQPDGWSKPESMPSSLNTEGDEVFPTSENDTLYFSSDFHNGMGGLDIFKTYLLPDNSWSMPVNMRSPINSGADDFSLAVDKNESSLKSGYFSSNREGTDDIFEFKQIKIIKEPEVIKDEVEEPLVTETEEEKVFVAIRVLEIFRENNDPNAKIVKKENLAEANLKMIFGDSITNVALNEEALAILEVPISKVLKFKAEKLSYLSDSKTINPSVELEKTDAATINVVLELEAIRYDTEIILENIYYDFNQWNIREDAAIALDSLVLILEDNPTINIQMGSHTDCRGSIDFNIDLSQKRAQSAVNYLSYKGINESRLSARGYGESQPMDPCSCKECSEEEHQRNRRTSFKIIRS